MFERGFSKNASLENISYLHWLKEWMVFFELPHYTKTVQKLNLKLALRQKVRFNNTFWNQWYTFTRLLYTVEKSLMLSDIFYQVCWKSMATNKPKFRYQAKEEHKPNFSRQNPYRLIWLKFSPPSIFPWLGIKIKKLRIHKLM